MSNCPVCSGSDVRMMVVDQDEFGVIRDYVCMNCQWNAHDDGYPEEHESCNPTM